MLDQAGDQRSAERAGRAHEGRRKNAEDVVHLRLVPRPTRRVPVDESTRASGTSRKRNEHKSDLQARSYRTRPVFPSSHRLRLAALWSFALFLVSERAFAHEPAPGEPPPHEEPAPVVEEPVDEATISGERSASEAASRVHVTRRELRAKAEATHRRYFRSRAGPLHRSTCGRRQGGSRFLRGFDADHGTDVALFVHGVPVNMVSHGHGQGYADVNFLIPSS